ncbi:MAG TPA: hypothetical protein VFE01_11205, partial [Terracidiphilus sp.]|nr:hypothetical protein [Terracidiphilus sp.]
VDDIDWATIDPLDDRMATIESLTPGTYRVFTLRGQRDMDFRDATALGRLGSGQQITLAPGESGKVVLTEVTQ